MNKNTATAILASSLALHSGGAWAGFALTQVTSSDGQAPMQVKILTDGTSSKIEYLTAMPNNPFMKPGSYLLSHGEEMFLVSPSEQTFARFDVGMMQGMAQEMAQAGPGGGMFEFKNVKVEKLLEEPGEKVAGYSTRHYQFKSSWTMAMKSMPISMDNTAVEDYWVTDALPIALGAGAGIMAASGLPPTARESDAAKVLSDVKGFPLRQVSVQSTKTSMAGLGGIAAGMMGKMGGQPMKTTTEITSVQELDLPADTFEVPAGYREVQLFQTGPAMPDLNSVGGKAAPPPNLNGAGGQAAPLPDLNTPR